jgi:hypothetical protein
MSWKRFPVPEFDHRPLKGLNYVAPTMISTADETRIVSAAESGDASVAGAYAVEPNSALLERLSFRGDFQQMILCALPGPGAHLLGRSLAWFNQRAYLLDSNAADAEVLHNWRTPRTHNTRLGPEDGITLDRMVIYILNGRILEDHDRGNRLMIDTDWNPGDGRSGYRIVCGCDKGGGDFHDSCFMFSWAA